MSEFKDRVIDIIEQVPYGKVASYGQIAVYAGVPRAARQVGWILNRSEGKLELPWWRIVNNQGRISIKGTEFNSPLLMKNLLEHENVDVNDDYTFDINAYRFRPSREQLKQWHLDDKYIETICSRFGI